MWTFWRMAIVLFCAGGLLGGAAPLSGQFGGPAEPPPEAAPADDDPFGFPPPETPAEPAPEEPGERRGVQLSPDIPGLTRLDPKGDVWIDMKRKIVVVDGRVALREGPLEMFACPRGSKEHESIVGVNAKPSVVHAGLLAVGAKSGTPVRWDPKYEAATGDVIEILVLWKDKEGNNRKARAQDWIKHSKTKKAMEYDWVFAGSGFWVDEDEGTRHYHADAGDFICVSNFSTATLDLPVKSSQDNNDLQFEAFTEHIPEKGTKVRLVLIPRKAAAKEAPPAADKPTEDKPADESTPEESPDAAPPATAGPEAE